MSNPAPALGIPAGLLDGPDRESYANYWTELLEICADIRQAISVNAHPAVVADLVAAGNLMLQAIRLFLQSRGASHLLL